LLNEDWQTFGRCVTEHGLDMQSEEGKRERLRLTQPKKSDEHHWNFIECLRRVEYLNNAIHVKTVVILNLKASLP